ncbi:hypothetical protein M426DRAFT_71891 [Hypoxylon sp. CI-4A]|nr:hypothetical protein M426DRAFT_71891 [Hypoxylon sp. CI-4A]
MVNTWPLPLPAIFNGNRFGKLQANPQNRPTQYTYPGEQISWQQCAEVKGRPIECSSVKVPIDQFTGTNSGNKTFTIPLVRMRGHNATKNLFLNPGGPGTSGTEFLYRAGEQLRTIVGEGFHLLSFDPRGVNASRPQATCYPDADTRRSRSRPHDIGVTAADLNNILDAVGQESLYYWGFSYGTTIGQTYATLYPGRAERVIIDGVENQFSWYEGLLSTDTFHDTERVWDGFLEECMKAGENCKLSSLAESKDTLKEKLFSFTEQLKGSPISVYVNNTVYGTLDYETIWYRAIFRALNKPATWYDLADRLAKLMQGNATEFFLAYAFRDPWTSEGDATEFVSFNDGYSGAPYWPQDLKSLLGIVNPYINESFFAPAEVGNYYIKQQWQMPRSHSYVPYEGVKTAHPLLILSTTYDPVCPLKSARVAHAAFEGSRIVEVQGYGHCSIAVPSTCLARHVSAFLYNGTLPDGHTKCEVDGPYFVKSEEDGSFKPQKYFADPEEQAIHLTQLELSNRHLFYLD